MMWSLPWPRRSPWLWRTPRPRTCRIAPSLSARLWTYGSSKTRRSNRTVLGPAKDSKNSEVRKTIGLTSLLMDGGRLPPSPWTGPAAEPSGWRHQGSSCTSWSVPSQTRETDSQRSPRRLRSAWPTRMRPRWRFGTASGDRGKVSVSSKSSFISSRSQRERGKGSCVPPLESATAAGWGTADLCSRPLYNVLPLCSPGGSSLSPGHTTQAENIVKYWIDKSYWIKSHTRAILFTSHMCPTIGASAQECSTLIPIFPLGYEISVKDLSNHLRGKERTEIGKIAPDVLQPVTVGLPTYRNTSREAGIWRSRQESGFSRGRNPAARRRESGRRQPTRWRPGRLCLIPGWNT